MKFLGLLLVFMTGFNARGLETAAGSDGVLLFARGTWQANLHWDQGPVVGQESRLRIDWKNAHQVPVVAPGAFTVTPFMPEMGHGTAPVKIQPVLDANGQPIVGSYEVTSMYLVMGGAWEIRVGLTVGSYSETETLQIDLAEPHRH